MRRRGRRRESEYKLDRDPALWNSEYSCDSRGGSRKQRGSAEGVIERVADHQGTNEGASRERQKSHRERRTDTKIKYTRGLKPERGECDDLNNSPQIAAPIIYGSLPANRYAAS